MIVQKLNESTKDSESFNPDFTNTNNAESRFVYPTVETMYSIFIPIV